MTAENVVPQLAQPGLNANGQKTQKTMSIEQYTKELEKMHRIRKLECEISEYEIRAYMAKMEMNKQVYMQQQAVLRAQEQTKDIPAHDSTMELTTPAPDLSRDSGDTPATDMANEAAGLVQSFSGLKIAE